MTPANDPDVDYPALVSRGYDSCAQAYDTSRRLELPPSDKLVRFKVQVTMYTPKAFREPDVGANLDFVEQQGFGALISVGAAGPVITHLPVLVDRGQGKLCLLRAHVARANDHWRSLDDRPATMVFSGPHCYVSAGWYRERKVVPTWNYVAVHLHGTARLVSGVDGARQMVADFVDHYDAGAPEPWTIPEDEQEFMDGLLSGIVAFTIDVERIEASWKLSQNHAPARRQRVIEALRELGRPNELQIADLMHRL